MDLHKKEKEKKRALALIREADTLRRQKYNIVPIKLDIPIHHGYVRSLELRDDVKQRGDYPKILEVINFLGQKKAYHSNKDFITRTKKTSVEKHAYLKSATDPRFKFYYTEAKRASDIEKIKSIEKYLWYHSSLYNCSCEKKLFQECIKHFRPHYYFRFPWMLKEVTKPYYLTHYTPLYGELESRLDKIEKELYYNHYYERYNNKRNVGDKLDKIDFLSTKYDDKKSVIYHALEEITDSDIIS
jgi:hypothetical protein